MTGLVRWLWEQFTGVAQLNQRRISAAQAIERARAAVDEEYRERLTMTMCIEEKRGWVWLVSEPAKGRVYSVEIDDATGEVLRAGFTGVR